ncbi:uncharacterized protein LOC119612373 isoform X2 [Lucilia sericata]|uniref:uncharacterized protein LOC119612373 isoform X2 n=1 Tax=Lucilia sericata TaxID=13632 RepID=UPI0018A82EF4|nr:uncharacterized protein LOC119612373 isoform X2 [Lucilia sericata]
MKIIFNILIVMVQLCASDSSVYDWQVKTIERDSDFANDFKVQTALNNERQQDLLKISGKTNNIDYYYPNSFNTQFNTKSLDGSSNKASAINNENKFDDQNNLNLNKKYKENSNSMDNLDQTKNSAKKFEAKNNEKFKSKNDETNNHHYDYNENQFYSKFNADVLKSQEANKNNEHDDQDRSEFNKNHKLLDYHDEDNNSYHDLNHLEHNSYKQSKDQDKFNNPNEQLGFDSINKENGSYNKAKIANKEKQDRPIINHCSGKYMNIESFVGTNLFDSTAKRCFTSEEVALLAIRKDFESLIPKDLPECLLNDHMVALVLNYFYICHQMILKTTSLDSKHLVQKAFYDTLGGYLNFYMVPVTKYSYYAGQISLNTAQQILTLHQESKQFLNTNGNGWKAPLQNVLMELKSVHIEPLHIAEQHEDNCNEPSFCMLLDIATDENQPNDEQMIVQLPKLEDEDGYLANIWLPFRRKRTFDLKSQSSAYVLVKFYETVTKCYRFDNIDQQYYNQQFKIWLMENINIHLSDEQFYPGLGAVLRIYEYLKKAKKDTNLFGDNLVELQSKDESFVKQQSPQIGSRKTHNIKKTKQRINNGKNITDQTNAEQRERNQTIHHDAKIPLQINLEITKNALETQSNAISSEVEDNKLDNPAQTNFTNTKSLLRTIDLAPPQMVVIAIPVIAIILVVIICCCKSFCKKKKSQPQLKTKKNSSSSSSILLNSPVRFFHIRKKSLSDYSSTEPGNKKNKRSVKIEKKPLLNSDTSASSSPVRNKKSIDKGKTKDSGKK